MLLRRRAISDLSDEDLVTRLRSGHQASLGTLWDRYAHLLFGVGLKYLKNTEASQDEVVELFATLPQLLGEHEVHNFRPWVHAVMRNRCLQALRKRRFDTHELDERLAEPEDLHDPLLEAGLQRLEQAIERLSDPQRRCIQLFHLQKLSYHQVAERTGYDIEQVRSHLQNGRRNLKLMLQHHADQNDI